MPQDDPVKKAALKAYLTSGAILVLSLLTFFYFHKAEDDKDQERIAELQAKLTESQKELQALKSAPPRSSTAPEVKPETKQQEPKQLVPSPPSQLESIPAKKIEPQPEPREETVYVTRTGSKFHRDGCQYLSRSQIPISKKDAIAQGYGACSRCNP